MIPNQTKTMKTLQNENDSTESLSVTAEFVDFFESIKENEKEEEEKEIQKFIKPKSRCYQCNKKLSMMSFTCKCDKMFCIAHQIPHNHKCNYNHKQEKMIQIQNDNPKMNRKFTPL